jgi:hypothetical protein
VLHCTKLFSGKSVPCFTTIGQSASIDPIRRRSRPAKKVPGRRRLPPVGAGREACFHYITSRWKRRSPPRPGERRIQRSRSRDVMKAYAGEQPLARVAQKVRRLGEQPRHNRQPPSHSSAGAATTRRTRSWGATALSWFVIGVRWRRRPQDKKEGPKSLSPLASGRRPPLTCGGVRVCSRAHHEASRLKKRARKSKQASQVRESRGSRDGARPSAAKSATESRKIPGLSRLKLFATPNGKWNFPHFMNSDDR